MMKRFATGCLGISWLIGCTTVPMASTIDPLDSYRPAPGSNEMLRAHISGIEGIEVLISDVVIPPGASVPRHYHPGEEFVYVIEGSAVHRQEGQGDRIYKAGETLIIPPEAIHAPLGGPQGARAIVFRIHKDGHPARILVD